MRGDRETLTKIYYFDKRNSVFYAKYLYSFYDPPKWIDSSKVVSTKESEYFILNSNLLKSNGENLLLKSKIRSDINKIISLNKKLYQKKKSYLNED